MESTNFLSRDLYLYHQVIRCIFRNHYLLLAYSGGLDSTVLLEILTTLKKYFDIKVQGASKILPFFLRAVYVHHGLHTQSDYWAEHCFQQCKIRDIPFQIRYINCCNFNKKKHNLEALARKYRYQALCDSLKPGETFPS